MNDPLVTTWTDQDGVQHWGSVDIAPAQKPVAAAPKQAEEVRADEAAVPAHRDGANPKSVKR